MIKTTVLVVSHCCLLEATTIATELLLLPENVQERALAMARLVSTTWRPHSLLPERRVAVEGGIRGGLEAVGAEVVRTEVRNKASLYELMYRLREALYILFRDKSL